MFHLTNSAGIALIVLLLPTAAHAEDANAASHSPAPQNQSIYAPSTDEISAYELKLRIGPGDPAAGRDKAEMCFGCHGEDGNSPDPQFPKLSGQYGIYMTKQMRNYLYNTRSHQMMGDIAVAVSDEDLDDISAYFASQPMMKGDHPSTNKTGKKLYDNNDLSRMMVRCKNCHGPTGKGLDPGNPVNPVIGGQHKEYLLEQLINFREGVRSNSTGGLMNTTVHQLSDKELEGLSDYISGL